MPARKTITLWVSPGPVGERARLALSPLFNTLPHDIEFKARDINEIKDHHVVVTPCVVFKVGSKVVYTQEDDNISVDRVLEIIRTLES